MQPCKQPVPPGRGLFSSDVCWLLLWAVVAGVWAACDRANEYTCPYASQRLGIVVLWAVVLYNTLWHRVLLHYCLVTRRAERFQRVLVRQQHAALVKIDTSEPDGQALQPLPEPGPLMAASMYA